MLRSRDALANRPSALQLTDRTWFVWPVRLLTAWPVFASQITTTPD
jgi:hypothetical protein